MTCSFPSVAQDDKREGRPVAVPGIFLADKRLRHLPTAATRSGRFFCHRQRSHRSPRPYKHL